MALECFLDSAEWIHGVRCSFVMMPGVGICSSLGWGVLWGRPVCGGRGLCGGGSPL